QQAEKFKPEFVVLSNREAYENFKKHNPGVKVYSGFEAIVESVNEYQHDLLINALVGARGLIPTITALEKKIPVAIANKETLVIAGKLVTELANKNNLPLLPIDSEHSAIWQCLRGEEDNKVKRIILTASGGPFRDTPVEELKNVSVEKALAHPNWEMGPKITIDSATMFNKGLEVIEAYWLYGVKTEQIDVTIHRESIIHSMVEFEDASIKAQLGIPDMKIPIGYAIFYPERFPVNAPFMDFTKAFQLHFEPPDLNKFRGLKLAYNALESGSSYPAVLNAANEIAVSAFLNHRISFLDITRVVENVLNEHSAVNEYTLEEILKIDEQAREKAGKYILKIEGKK
ncbi:MAG: 1-deoxy-D-xylulose-5-phosphate reductoisomerase, partial [Calditrichia bacterium]|nr:1-deoxy-D-xylulose-5-phosphate reductoisomerase [Calditrichia bacterium]